MSLPLVAVGGPPGSGKTTAALQTAEILGLEYHSAGARFRAQAEEHDMPLDEFSRFAGNHPEVDRDLDEYMLGLSRPGRLLDARLAGPLARRAGVAVLYLVVTARPEVRAKRLAARDHLPVAAARRAMLAREESEHTRYLALYGIDLAVEPTDLNVDSSEISAAEVVTRLVDFIRARDTPSRA